MLSGDYTGLETSMALGALIGSLWLLSVSLFGLGVTGLAFRTSPIRVRFCLRAGLTLAVLLSPFFGLMGYCIFREAFVSYDLHCGQYFWTIVCGLGMPIALLIIIAAAFPLLRTTAKRIARQDLRQAEA